jgi:hypothetical protein
MKGLSHMKVTSLRISCMTVALLIPIAFTTQGASEPRQGHSERLTAKMTLPDGTSRTVRLEGVGCPVSICSRVSIKGKAEGDSLVKVWLDSLAAIRDTTAKDALFVSKDGTAQRLSLVYDFRVLYLENHLGGTQKLDLTKVKSIEFLAPAQQRR